MKTPPRHYYQLDVLRAFAVFSVFLFHWHGEVFHRDHFPWAGLWRDWSQAHDAASIWLHPLSFGWVGVPLFFVISGFCIHLNWASGKIFSASHFYWRRFWRIVPLYWLVLAFFAWRSWNLLRQESSPVSNLISHIFFVHNLKRDWFFSICPAFWSLALEVQFYLVYPLLLKWRRHWSMEKILAAALVGSVALRAAVFFLPGELYRTQEFVFMQNTPMLWFDWLLGAVIAERQTAGGPRLFHRPIRTLVVCATLFLLSIEFFPMSFFRYTLASVCMAVVLENYLRRSESPRVLERLAVPLGICSYSFYLLHQRLLSSVAYHWPQSHLTGWVVLGVVAFIAIFAVSGLSYWVLERNFLSVGERWGRRLFRSQTHVQPAGGPTPGEVGLAPLANERHQSDPR